MADSDDDYERRKGRDKFRRERNDYERRDDRRREGWDESFRSRQSVRSREIWNNSRNTRDRRELYVGGGAGAADHYDNRRRERFSPVRHDMRPNVKRIRRDWNDAYHHFDIPYGGRGAGHAPMHFIGGQVRHPWARGMEIVEGMPPPQEFAASVGVATRCPEPDFPTQPPLLNFKQFLSQQDDAIGEEEAIRKYNEYKLGFRRQQISEFFVNHKEEEWFKLKYHPEEHTRRQQEIQASLEKRLVVFKELCGTERLDGLVLDVDKDDSILKILDAAVIRMEGGTDLDLSILDQSPCKNGGSRRVRSASENLPAEFAADDKVKEEAVVENRTPAVKPTPETCDVSPVKLTESEVKRASSLEEKDDRYKSDSSSDSDSEMQPDLTISGLERDASDIIPAEGKRNGVGDGGDEEGEETGKEDQSKAAALPDKEGSNTELVATGEQGVSPMLPRPLHQTSSIFLRNLPPCITKQEVEALCRRYPGFVRVAIQDPQVERCFVRRGWATFARNVNIKEICWSLNSIKLRDCELGATLNRELRLRVRPVNGLTVHRSVARNDIRVAARIVQNLDCKWLLWAMEDDEMKDQEATFDFRSTNPVLRNITDYLVEEGSYEEDELLGTSTDNQKDSEHVVSVERDDTLLKVLDRIIIYLRIVHSVDYYSANEYPNEDEMPHRCGIMHARGMPPGPTSTITQSDVTEYMTGFEMKCKPFLETVDLLSESECMKLGKKMADAEVEKFVQANTQELGKDKWLCPLSGKKFKGPDFVRKHIFNKHCEKVEEVKKEVLFFNNYLADPKRPALPEHPSNHPPPPSRETAVPSSTAAMTTMAHHPPATMISGFPVRHPPMMFAGAPPYCGPAFAALDARDYPRRGGGGGRPYGMRRNDSRPIVEYRDLDAPDEMDIF